MFVVDVLVLVLGLVPLDQPVLVLDGLGALLGDLFLLGLGEFWEVLLAVVDEESVGAGDQFAAVETVALSFAGADHLAAVEAVVDEVVLLTHAVALHPLHEHLLGRSLALLAHKQRVL